MLIHAALLLSPSPALPLYPNNKTWFFFQTSFSMNLERLVPHESTKIPWKLCCQTSLGPEIKVGQVFFPRDWVLKELFDIKDALFIFQWREPRKVFSWRLSRKGPWEPRAELEGSFPFLDSNWTNTLRGSLFCCCCCFVFNWRLITLQYCSGFCHTLTWISYGFSCVPHPEPPPTSLHIPSPSIISVHQPWAPCLKHRTWTGDPLHIW